MGQGGIVTHLKELKNKNLEENEEVKYVFEDISGKTFLKGFGYIFSIFMVILGFIIVVITGGAGGPFLIGGLFLILVGVGILLYVKRMEPPGYWFVTNKRILKDELGGLEASLKEISDVSTGGIQDNQVKIYLGNQEIEEQINEGEDFKNAVLREKREMERSKIINYCRNCGEEVEPSNEYCPECGALIK